MTWDAIPRLTGTVVERDESPYATPALTSGTALANAEGYQGAPVPTTKFRESSRYRDSSSAFDLEAPLFTIPLTLAGFTMSIIAMTFVHAWVYYSTGSVFLSILLHSWANVTNPLAASLLPDDPAAAGMSGIVTAGLAWLFVVWLNRRYGKETLASDADNPWKVGRQGLATD